MTDNGVKPSTIRKRIDAHRLAVQSADPEAARATWDKLEDYVGSVFSLSPKDKITDPDAIRKAALEDAVRACQNQLTHIAPDEGGGVLLPVMVDPYDAGCNDCTAAILDLINQP